jgi:hypothetical protein
MSRAWVLSLVLAVSCSKPAGHTLPARWHGAIRPMGAITLDTKTKYDFTLAFDTYADGKVTGTMEWPGEIRTNKVWGQYDGEHMTLEDDDGDKKDLHLVFEPAKGCMEGPRGRMHGTDKNGTWQLDAIAGQSAPTIKETHAE